MNPSYFEEKVRLLDKKFIYSLRWIQMTLSDIDADNVAREESSHMGIIERRSTV